MANDNIEDLPASTPGIVVIKDYPNGTSLIECHHHSSQVTGVICGVCRASISETRPVKKVVRLTAGKLL